MGGSISYPEPLHLAQAETYLRTLFPQPPLYARVDGVISNHTFQLMELELIEPYLFLNANNRLMENYYRALVAQIS